MVVAWVGLYVGIKFLQQLQEQTRVAFEQSHRQIIQALPLRIGEATREQRVTALVRGRVAVTVTGRLPFGTGDRIRLPA
ncbi:MAG TPA: hypothetical protein PKZ76_02470 [Xanthomonadaceae bacterium]|nr:hypothetical protein [Xanthomonadaceae bacterium]